MNEFHSVITYSPWKQNGTFQYLFEGYKFSCKFILSAYTFIFNSFRIPFGYYRFKYRRYKHSSKLKAFPCLEDMIQEITKTVCVKKIVQLLKTNSFT